jgi:uncharacterized phiE125 gp8 family phage protein
MRYKVKTAPVLFPAALDDVKRNVHIDTADIDTDRDALLNDLIKDAITASQNATGRQYCRATFYLYMDAYPEGGEIEITAGPVAAITSVKYLAPGATELSTLDPSKYQLDSIELTARLRFLESFSVDCSRMNVIEIEFTNGWTTAADVPADIKQAVVLRACESYLHPENPTVNHGIGLRTTIAEIKEKDYKVQRF